jgi:DNA-directed RNA polymerase specialized sigma24 family protein
VSDSEIVRDLLSGKDTERAWETFLNRFSNLILKIIWQSERDYDEVMESYLFVCRKLAEGGFARLRRFTERGGNAPLFTTWLAAVTHNLCIDAHRARHGRRQFPRAITRLTDLDRKIFRLYYWKGCSVEEIQTRSGQFGTTPEGVSDSIARIERTIAASPVSTGSRVVFVPFDENETGVSASDETDLRELEGWLHRWISTLSSQDQMILRLRFWEDMTAPEIARAMKISPTERVYPLLRRALQSLREQATLTYGSQSSGAASV